MPVYGLGTWQFGGNEAHDPDNDDKANIAAIRSAIKLGVTHIDTAEIYADGYNEILIGKAIQGLDRSKLFIASKVYRNHARYDAVITAAKDSLRRLGITYLDLYYTHRMNPPDVPYRDTMRAMDRLVDEGLVKQIGICNYTIDAIQEAQSHLKHKIVAAQLHLNLQYREPERKGVLQYCQENDMLFVAWRPLQKGALLSSPVLQEIAKKYRKTPAQIALNWLISQKNVVTLSKTGSRKHLQENLGALGWELEKEDIEKLRTDFPDQQAISDTVPLA